MAFSNSSVTKDTRASRKKSELNEEDVNNELAIETIQIEVSSNSFWEYYKCRMCSYTTKSLRIIYTHLNCHKLGVWKVLKKCTMYVEPYTCKDCNFKSPIQLCFKEHTKLCKKLLKAANTKNEKEIRSLYLRSYDKNSCLKTYKCGHCLYVSYSEVCYIMHQMKCKRTSTNIIDVEKNKKPQQSKQVIPPSSSNYFFKNIYHCPQCSFKCSLLGDLTKHVDVHQGKPDELKKVEKPICKITHVESLSKDKKVQHNTIVKPCSTFLCDKCGFTTKERKILDSHVAKTHDVKTCDDIKVCNFKSKNSNEYSDHILLKHVTMKTVIHFKCHLCQYDTVDKKEIIDHVSAHVFQDETRQEECELCHNKFKMGTLKQHILYSHIL